MLGDGVGVGINGLGRIGRLLLRKAFEMNTGQQVQAPRITAINSVHPLDTIVHLLKYDTIHGPWNAQVKADGNDLLIINGQPVRVTYERQPNRIPWKSLGVQIVIDASGKFTDRSGASQHLQAGAHKVIVTAPGKQLDFTAVMGVNDHLYDPKQHQLLSTASCTTNCAAPLLYVLDTAFGIEEGWVTSVHAYTSDQRALDNPHADLRRARACTHSIVPTSTGIGKALSAVLPHLSKKIRGLSLRVPVQNVSIADITLTLRSAPSAEEVRTVFQTSPLYNRYISWCDEPLVSTDFTGNSFSAIIDGLSLASDGRQLKLLAWYDNEWGYACRVLDMLQQVCHPLQTSTKVG
ncbi:type I glyceraldehyde-3-phosphate dehydrogenase [Paenibacillus senegalensis]|uniref:type I glyceraldehyde-3-phosphate dehydrogenase n=1 Tax=Paenibacillus senegalensis TaxID=1465766 RepID=UPI00028A1F7E|nr:glyceraldehyde 3-phosphate dehydrogenase NAD-binding domain-containing protein [Paenibacillus senegalensis]